MALNSYFLEQNCLNVLKTCNFAGAAGENCAAEFCNGFPSTSGTCVGIGLDGANCCSSSDPAACLNNWVHNGGGPGVSNPCAGVLSMLIGCSSASPALFPSSSFYTSGPYATSLASCLCYEQDGTYDTLIDDYASTCVASGSAAHPTYYKYGTLMDGFCTKNAGPAAAVASTTSIAGSSARSSAAAGSTVPSTSHSAASSASTGSAASVSNLSSASVLSASASSPPSSAAVTTTSSKSSAKQTKKPFQSAAMSLLVLSILATLY